MHKTAESVHLKDDLSNYDKNAYEKPSVTVDVAICTIFNSKLQVLLIKRLSPPFRNYYAIPGGFVSIEKKESLEDAAKRKLSDETGIGDVYLEQLKTYGDPSRDPRMRIITVAYYALVPYIKIQNCVPEAAKNASWFPLTECPQKIAFDHKTILSDLLNRLRGKIAYSPIGFSFVDEKFTWTELQDVYEIILGKKLLTPNFRRKLLSMYNITELDEKKKTRGRPSSLLIYAGEKEF